MLPIFAVMRHLAFLLFCFPVLLLAQNKEPITDVMHISPDGVPYRKQKRKRDKN